jgi:hypothetical protein
VIAKFFAVYSVQYRNCEYSFTLTSEDPAAEPEHVCGVKGVSFRYDATEAVDPSAAAAATPGAPPPGDASTSRLEAPHSKSPLSAHI